MNIYEAINARRTIAGNFIDIAQSSPPHYQSRCLYFQEFTRSASKFITSFKILLLVTSIANDLPIDPVTVR